MKLEKGKRQISETTMASRNQMKKVRKKQVMQVIMYMNYMYIHAALDHSAHSTLLVAGSSIYHLSCSL